jgi:hypothetical protein
MVVNIFEYDSVSFIAQDSKSCHMDCSAVNYRKIEISTQEVGLVEGAAGLAVLSVLRHMGFALEAVVLRPDWGMVAVA